MRKIAAVVLGLTSLVYGISAIAEVVEGQYYTCTVESVDKAWIDSNVHAISLTDESGAFTNQKFVMYPYTDLDAQKNFLALAIAALNGNKRVRIYVYKVFPNGSYYGNPFISEISLLKN